MIVDYGCPVVKFCYALLIMTQILYCNSNRTNRAYLCMLKECSHLNAREKDMRHFVLANTAFLTYSVRQNEVSPECLSPGHSGDCIRFSIHVRLFALLR